MAKKPTNPDEAKLRDHALGYPEVTEDFPWGHRALKVRGKAFVFMGTGKEGGADHDDFFLTVKLPESGVMALSLEEVQPTGYGLGKSGWVSARYPRGKAPVPMLLEWLDESYRAVAPKTLVKSLDAPAPAKKKAAAKPKPKKPSAKKKRP